MLTPITERPIREATNQSQSIREPTHQRIHRITWNYVTLTQIHVKEMDGFYDDLSIVSSVLKKECAWLPRVRVTLPRVRVTLPTACALWDGLLQLVGRYFQLISRDFVMFWFLCAYIRLYALQPTHSHQCLYWTNEYSYIVLWWKLKTNHIDANKQTNKHREG